MQSPEVGLAPGLQSCRWQALAGLTHNSGSAQASKPSKGKAMDFESLSGLSTREEGWVGGQSKCRG